MEEVEDTVGVHSDSPSRGRVVGSEADGVRELAGGRGRHGLVRLIVTLLYRDLLAAGLATDTLGDVDAGLGRVAGFARVEGVLLRRGGGSLGFVGALRVGTLPLRRVAGGGGVGLAVTGEAAGFGGCAVAFLSGGVARRGLEGGICGVGHACGVRCGCALPLACC